MKQSRIEKLAHKAAEIAANAYVGYKSGEFNSTRTKMRTSMESIGIIDSVLIVDSVLFVVAYRAEMISSYNKEHEGVVSTKEYYNCRGDLSSHSVYELLMPVTNVSLAIEVVDPRTLIGAKVMVSEINGTVVKAELIGSVEGFTDSPLTIPRTLLTSIRNYIGGYTRMDSDEERVTKVVDELGLSGVVKDLYAKSPSDFSGKVFSYENQAVYSRDTAKLKEGEGSLKVVEGLTRHITNEGMKTKNCHLPVKLFSAR